MKLSDSRATCHQLEMTNQIETMYVLANIETISVGHKGANKMLAYIQKWDSVVNLTH